MHSRRTLLSVAVFCLLSAPRRAQDRDTEKRDLEKANAIDELIKRLPWKRSSLTWVDGNDEAKEGKFVDCQGEPLKFARWNPGDPNNWSNYQHRVAIGAGTGANLRDETGAHRFRYICEWDYE